MGIVVTGLLETKKAEGFPLVLWESFDYKDGTLATDIGFTLASGVDLLVKAGELTSDRPGSGDVLRDVGVRPQRIETLLYKDTSTTPVPSGGQHFNRFDDVMILNELLTDTLPNRENKPHPRAAE